jgi:hypothetical protein
MSRGVLVSLVVKSRRIFHHHEDYRSVCFRLPSFDRDRRALYSRQRMIQRYATYPTLERDH